MINVLVNGSNGKMGTVLRYCIKKAPDIFVKYELDKDTSISLQDLDNISDKPDVIIDFSTPEASLSILDYATCHLIPIVIATTGFTDTQKNQILEYSQAIPIFQSSNMSYIVHLLGKVLGDISPLLSYMDIEITEKHHNCKKDAPSGTAIFLANCINSSCENIYNYVFDRHNNNSSRTKNEIGFSSIRGGNIVGEHSVLFLGENEAIELKHIAYSREIFAEGAIRASRFIINKPNGLYSMENLLE